MKRLGPHQIATIQMKRGEEIISFGSVHYVHERHWCVIKLRAVILGRFSSWRDDELVKVPGFVWPFIRGNILAMFGKGDPPVPIGFIYTQPLDNCDHPIYAGELWGVPTGPTVRDDIGWHQHCVVAMDDVGDATKRKEEPNAFQQKDHKSYEEIFGRG